MDENKQKIMNFLLKITPTNQTKSVKMKLHSKSVLYIFSMLVSFLLLYTHPVEAQIVTTQEPLGIAYQLEVTFVSTSVEDGMIISQRNNGYSETVAAYDRAMFGVVDLSPSIEFTFGGTETTYPVISDGTANVLVSGESGPIKPGDSITSSTQPGIGMKATKSGFTLGIAESSFEGTTAAEKGLVTIRFNKQFTFGEDTPDSETIAQRLREVVSLSAIAAVEEPKEVLKYLVAGIVLLSSVFISFFTLSRTSQKGIEAIGRNPLARGSIVVSIFVNIGVSIAIIISGVIGAYMIVTF